MIYSQAKLKSNASLSKIFSRFLSQVVRLEPHYFDLEPTGDCLWVSQGGSLIELSQEIMIFTLVLPIAASLHHIGLVAQVWIRCESTRQRGHYTSTSCSHALRKSTVCGIVMRSWGECWVSQLWQCNRCSSCSRRRSKTITEEVADDSSET